MRRAPLFAAAEAGSTDRVRLQLSKGANVDGKGPDGEAPLHLAAREGHWEVAALLLDHHADPAVRTIHPRACPGEHAQRELEDLARGTRVALPHRRVAP